jgi:hypothetical protein
MPEKSKIFAYITSRKGTILFYILTKTASLRAGDMVSPAFFLL